MMVAKEHETSNMLEKNLQLLTPWLRDTVLQIDDNEMEEKIEITYNNEGLPICCYHQGEKVFHINSKYPIQESEIWYQSTVKQDTSTIFLFGSGFGYPLFELFKHKQPHTFVVVFEEDLYLFKVMLCYFDLEPIIKTQKILFFIGNSANFATALEQLFYSAYFISCTSPTIIFTKIAERNFKQEYNQIYQYVLSQLSLFIFYVGNDHKDNLIGFCNLVSNVHEIIKAPNINCLKSQCKNIPAFIIANGPSLDQNIQQLKKVQDKGLIIAVESAIIPLLKNNIKPDILAVIERTPNTYTYHFKNIDYPNDIVLLSLAVVNKHVYPSFAGPKIPIFREKEVVNEWFSSYLGDNITLDVGSNVSHLATEIAVYLGANPIVYVGQDFAYGQNSVSHSTNSIYSEKSGEKLEKAIQSMPIEYVEGNNGKPVASNQLWVNFKKGLERKIALHSLQDSNLQFVNATEGGAKIEGTICDTLNNSIKQYCMKSYLKPVYAIVNESSEFIDLPQRIKKLKEFIKSMEDYQFKFRQYVLRTIEGKLNCKKMLRLSISINQESNHDLLEKTYQENVQVFNDFMSDSLLRSFLQQAIIANYYSINRLGLINTPEKITEVFRIHYDIYSHFNVITQSISNHFEKAVEELKTVLAEWQNNKAGEQL